MASRTSDDGPDAAPPPAEKRRRVALACTACRLRKSRCDGRRASCSSCLSLGVECQYEPGESTTNVIVRKEYMSDLGRRMSSVEEAVQRLNYVLEGHVSACGGDAQVRPSNFYQAPAQEQRDTPRAIWLQEPQDEDASTNGMAMTFIEERTAVFFGGSSNTNFARLLLRAVNGLRQSSGRVSPAAGRGGALDESNLAKASRCYVQPPAGTSPDSGPLSMTTLPSTEQMDNLLDIYFDTAGVVYPFIHEATFRDELAECKANGWTKVRRTWLGTLNMVFAMATNFNRDGIPSGQERLERSKVFFTRATHLCGELSKQVVSLEIVHYLLLIVIHCQGSQRSVQAWNTHGLLVRSAMALGLHSAAASKGPDPSRTKYHRRTWVVIYCMDKVLSVAYGRPAIIPEEHMMSRPLTSESHVPSLDASRPQSDIAGEFLAVSFGLHQLMSRSLNKQYAGNFEDADPELDDMAALQSSGELRKALRQWSACLPSNLGLCEANSDEVVENTPINRLRVILTLRYHNVSILVHRPLLGTTIAHLSRGVGGSPPPYTIQLAMGEAHECLRAAQSTVELVHAVISADQTSKSNLGMGYFTLYYVFTASLVIIARVLWAQHGQDVVDEAAVAHSRRLLTLVDEIFQKLDHDNNLVFRCSKYLRNMLEICTSLSPMTRAQSQDPEHQSMPHTGSGPEPTLLESMPYLGAGDLDMFQLYSGEMFDPTVFEGLVEPNSDGSTRQINWLPSAEWT